MTIDSPTEGLAAEIAHMRRLADGWRGPHLRQVEASGDLKIYGGTIADDIDRWADLLAALNTRSTPPVDTAVEGEIAALVERLRRANHDPSLFRKAADTLTTLSRQLTIARELLKPLAAIGNRTAGLRVSPDDPWVARARAFLTPDTEGAADGE